MPFFIAKGIYFERIILSGSEGRKRGNEVEDRLQKVIARVYGISRRHAEKMIADGIVCINGEVAHLGSKIDCEKDTLSIGQKKLLPQQLKVQFSREVWMLFKPKGVVCTHDDPFSKKKLEWYMPNVLRRQKWMFIGRLDKDTEGLLLLTNDGNFANQVAHPATGIKKVYRVHLDKNFDLSLCYSFKQGCKCQGEWLHFEAVRVVNSRKIDVTLVQGKKREIRRLLFAFGYEVVKLKRWCIGKLALDKRLVPGQSRRLSVKEVQQIFE